MIRLYVPIARNTGIPSFMRIVFTLLRTFSPENPINRRLIYQTRCLKIICHNTKNTSIIYFFMQIFIALPLIAATLIPLISHAGDTPPAESIRAKTSDGRGFIDPFMLQRALLKLNAMPKGDQLCDFLQDRTGDPVAEVILRICETAPMLDRTGIASSCSGTIPEENIARDRLYDINLRPALRDWLLGRAEPDNCRSHIPAIDTPCRYQFSNDRYEQAFTFVEVGFMGVKGLSDCN